MKKIDKRYIIMMIITGLFVFTTAASAGGIKERMKARQPQIKALKAAGIIGENNKGFLEFVGSLKKDEPVVSAENQDRAKVYRAIAKQQGTTSDLVGKRRALKLLKKAGPGHWIQGQNGKWVKK